MYSFPEMDLLQIIVCICTLRTKDSVARIYPGDSRIRSPTVAASGNNAKIV